jgi:hypothetical protein
MEMDLYDSSANTLPARGGPSSNHGWDEKVETEDHDQSQSPNDVSQNDPFKNHNEKAAFNDSDCVDLESAQRPSSVRGEDAEGANIVSWDSPDDPANPLNWPSWRRWVLVNLVSVITLMAGLS